MKILFLTTAFNGMAQRAWIELDRLDHQVKVQIASDKGVKITGMPRLQRGTYPQKQEGERNILHTIFALLF